MSFCQNSNNYYNHKNKYNKYNKHHPQSQTPAPEDPTPGWKPKYNMQPYHQSIARDHPSFPTVPLLTDGISPTFAEWKVAVLDLIVRTKYTESLLMAGIREVTCAFAHLDQEAVMCVEIVFGKGEFETAESLFAIVEKRMDELAAERSMVSA